MLSMEYIYGSSFPDAKSQLKLADIDVMLQRDLAGIKSVSKCVLLLF